MKNWKSVGQTGTASPDHGAAPAKEQTGIVDVRDLLGGEAEMLLRLDAEIYRLRITSKGKLILTK